MCVTQTAHSYSDQPHFMYLVPHETNGRAILDSTVIEFRAFQSPGPL